MHRLAGNDPGNRGGVGGLDLDLPPLGLRKQGRINPLTYKQFSALSRRIFQRRGHGMGAPKP
jgi:hypothetical protein